MENEWHSFYTLEIMLVLFGLMILITHLLPSTKTAWIEIPLFIYLISLIFVILDISNFYLICEVEKRVKQKFNPKFSFLESILLKNIIFLREKRTFMEKEQIFIWFNFHRAKLLISRDFTLFYYWYCFIEQGICHS